MTRRVRPWRTSRGAAATLRVGRRVKGLASFDGADSGKTAHYMLRWVSMTGEKGPWSETTSATVGA